MADLLFGGSGFVTIEVVVLGSTALTAGAVVGTTTGGGGFKTFVTLSLMKSYMFSMLMVQSSGSNFMASIWLFAAAVTKTE